MKILGTLEEIRLSINIEKTIESPFGTAKEQYGFQYTQYNVKARMEMKVGLTFACMNLKKLAKMQALKELKDRPLLLVKEISHMIPRNLNQSFLFAIPP